KQGPFLTALGVFALLHAGTPISAADVEADARSILTANCVKCHGPTKQKGGLRLDSRDATLGKGDSGETVVVPGRAGARELIRRVTATDAVRRMPPGDVALTDAQVETLRRWVDAGAPWPRTAARPAATGRPELVVTEDDRRHWAFLPLRAVEPPAVADGRWPSTPIDRFVIAGLATKQLIPTPPASPRTLIRGVTFDLIGLPPTPDEVEAFCEAAARDPDAAWSALVDRLLASPRYGERWGRHWLDVARYADSSGYEEDFDRPNAYHY